jgi:hypothetical protein
MPAIDVKWMRPNDPLPPEIVVEFEGLLMALDVGRCTRRQWDRFKTIIAIATLEAQDADAGAIGYAKALRKWRCSHFYDGTD